MPIDTTSPTFRNLDYFTQGYIEAMFFTECHGDNPELDGKGFFDLNPGTLENIIEDCRTFLILWKDCIKAGGINSLSPRVHKDTMRAAGHDYWLTRNGHGAGFWDGDWPEPMASLLTEAAHAGGGLNLVLGDDNSLYLE